MLAIRTVAVGLGLSVYLMYAKYTTWAKWFISNTTLQAFWNSLHALSRPIATTVSLGTIGTVGFIIACLAIGLFIAGCFYPYLELFLLNCWRILTSMVLAKNKKCIRNEKKVYCEPHRI